MDVGTITDPLPPSEPEEAVAGPSSSKAIIVPAIDEPPAYTKVPPPPTEAEILLHAHPRNSEVGDEVDNEDYESLVDHLGVRCTVLEAELRKRGVGSGREVQGTLLSA